VDEKIVMTFAGLIADENTVGIASNEISGDDVIDCTHQVKGAAAVTGFVILVDSVARLTGAAGKIAGEKQARGSVVIYDRIVANGDIRSADDQNPLEQRIFYGESGYRHIGKPGIIVTIDEDPMCEACGIDDCLFCAGSNERHGNANCDLFVVGSGMNIDDIMSGGVTHRGLNL
jgi:hypothetical protein